MNKIIELDEEAKAMVIALGNKLVALSRTQDVTLIGCAFQLSAIKTDLHFFSFHPQETYLVTPSREVEERANEQPERGEHRNG